MKKITTPNDPAQHIAVFQETTIRRIWHNEEWWFAIVDVVGVLTDSVQPEGYVKDLRRRDPELAKGWGQIATPLRVPTAGGAQRVNCANTEGLFRIIQSVMSPKAEPFKRWLAQVGYVFISTSQGELTLRPKDTEALRKRRLYTLMAAIAENPLPDNFLSDATRLNNPPQNPFADWQAPSAAKASAKATAKGTTKAKGRK